MRIIFCLHFQLGSIISLICSHATVVLVVIQKYIFNGFMEHTVVD